MEAIRQPACFSWCCSTFYTLFFLKFWKNSVVVHFPAQNMLKYWDLFCEWKIHKNYATLTRFFGSFKAGDSTCSRFIMFACTPMRSETWRQYSMSCWCMTRIRKYYAILFLFAELKMVRSYAGQFPSWAEPCDYMLFLCGHFHEIAIMQAVM